MDKESPDRLAVLGVGLALIGIALPYAWHEMPTLLSYPLTLMGFALIAWVAWTHLSTKWATANRGDAEAGLQYLHDRDTQLDLAIYLMIQRSAWARWIAAQFLAGNGKPIDDKALLLNATSCVVHEAVEGALEIRGTLPTETESETIPRENWRLAYLDVVPNPRGIWAFPVKPRSDVDPDRIRRLLSYDSLIVDARQFEKIWPRRDKTTDAATLELLRKARKAGIAPHEIDRLRPPNTP